MANRASQDQVNHHYLQIFGVSIAIGAVAGLKPGQYHYGLNESAADAYRQGVATSLSQTSLHILDRYLNVLPTFTIREGHRVKVYLSDDLLLPAYEQHRPQRSSAEADLKLGRSNYVDIIGSIAMSFVGSGFCLLIGMITIVFLAITFQMHQTAISLATVSASRRAGGTR